MCTLRTYCLDDARPFVSKYTWQRDGVIAVPGDQVSMVQAKRYQAHDGFVWPGVVKLDVFNDKGLFVRAYDGRSN